MSTGLECRIIEPLPNEWYYVLQNWDCPTNCWDWREFATATGPFLTEEAAKEYLFEHESNPGGYSVTPYEEFSSDNVYRTLIRTARNIRRTRW
jgi:hypothetical protein